MSKNKNQPDKQPNTEKKEKSENVPKKTPQAMVKSDAKMENDTKNVKANTVIGKSDVNHKGSDPKVSDKVNIEVHSKTEKMDTMSQSHVKKTDTPATESEKKIMQNQTLKNSTDKPSQPTKKNTTQKIDVPKQPPQKSSEQSPRKQKNGNLFHGIAIFLGILGTALGAYAFNELRTLKSFSANNQNLNTELESLSKKVASLLKNPELVKVNQQLTGLAIQQKRLEASEAKFNQRISQVEQIQKGLSQSVKADIDMALVAKIAGLDTMLAKVEDIDLSQKGLFKNLQQVISQRQSIDKVWMIRQEVGYLLRIANYKLQLESDLPGTMGLLKMAEGKLLSINQGKTDALIDAIRAKIIQLSGVKIVDKNAILADLRVVELQLPKLVVKPQKSLGSSDSSNAETESNILGKIGSMIASGIKYTPKDPSKIDISAETALIEKRLMQVDVKAAAFAVKSHDKVLLAQSVQSVKNNLDKYFANDETAQLIRETLSRVNQIELEINFPDLLSVVKRFEARQAQ